jgi:hypothetical protein
MRMKVKSFEYNVCDGYDMTYRPHYRPHDPFSDGPQCGNCRVVLEDNWYNRVDKETDGMSSQEVSCLKETVSDIQANTRLACCIPIESWMNGMTLKVDPGFHEGGVTELH